MAEGFKLAAAMVSIGLDGLPGLGNSLKSAKGMFDNLGKSMQGSIDKSMANVKKAFSGFGTAMSGAATMSSGLAASMKGLNRALNGVAGAWSGTKGWQPVIDGMSGLRTAVTGAGTSLRGLGQMSTGVWSSLRAGVGALGNLAGAAGHAGGAIASAGAAASRAGFKQAFAAARSAASSFASGASASMRSFSTSVSGAVSAVRSGASSMGSSFSSLLGKIHPLRLALAGIAATVGGGLLGTKLAADAEATEASFKTMLGGGAQGAAKAKSLMGNVSQFAAATPYELPELTSATRKLLAFGSSEKGVMNDLRTIGDIASGIQAPIGEIAEIYGKARVQGRLFAEDINQLTGRGIPIIQELAKQFGVSESEVRKLTEQGQIGFPQLEKAFQDMTAKGGKFYGMMAEQSTTAKGLWSTMADNIKAVARDLGGAFLPAAKAVMSTFIDLSGNASSWVDPLKAKIGALSDRIVAGMPSIIAWFKQAWVYVKAWGGTQVAIFGAIVRVIGKVTSALAGLLPTMSGYGNAFLEVHANAKFFFDHFESYVLLAWEHTKLFASNSTERFKTFFANVGIVLKWFGDNWKSVFQTIWDFTKTVIENLGKNLGAFFMAAKDWIAGKGFNFKWTGLTEGFESSIAEMPNLLKAKIRETTPELDRLYDELGEARRRHTAEGKEGDEGQYQLEPDVDKGGGKKEPGTAAGGKLAFHGLTDFYKHIQGGANTIKEKQAEDRDKAKVAALQQLVQNTKPGAAPLQSHGITVEP